MRGKNIQYLPAVDQLRGIAALLIIFYHGLHIFSYYLRFGGPFTFDGWLQSDSPLLGALIEGHTAVALFMVLSGFIFAYGVAGAEIRYGSFIYNRVLRIFPMFLCLYIVGLYSFPQSYSFAGFLQGVLLQSNLPGSAYVEPYTSLFWTIAVEFQFYLIFPFIVRFQRRQGLRYPLLLIGLFIVFRVMALALGANVRDLSYSTIVGRIDQFIFGMLAAQLYRARPKPGPAAVAGLLGIGVALVAALAAFHRLGGYPSLAWWKILWPTGEGALWAGFIYCYLAVFNQVRTPVNRALGYVGEISYSLYLTHIIVIDTLARHAIFLAPGQHFVVSALLTTGALVLPLAVALSSLTYYLVERPFLEMRRVYLVRPAAEGERPASSAS